MPLAEQEAALFYFGRGLAIRLQLNLLFPMAVKVIVRLEPLDLWSNVRIPSYFLEATELAGFLLRPASLGAFLLASWRLGADLGWTQAFLFESGLAAHWQVWAGIGVLILLVQRRMAKSVLLLWD